MRVGSLFSGYGGLDMAVGGDLAWYSEIEPAACKVMEAHYPGVPNLGDITKVDWSQVEPVDVITGGYPCQPFSTAGNRKGKHDERHLWPHVRDAIVAIRPRRAVLENVRGHLTLGFADVLADLACLGVSARWGVIRASDAGAPHARARLFIVAYPKGRTVAESGNKDAQWPTELRKLAGITANTSRERHGSGQRTRSLAGMGSAAEGSRWPASTAWQESGARSIANDWNSDSKDDAPQQQGHWQKSEPTRVGSDDRQGHTPWGVYEAAIRKWQHVIGRPAPAPTIHRNERDRLNPVFVEWMMGLPEGHVTGHGLSPSQELKMLGNGVVPQQACLALQLLGARP
jgi:DNA (cytosine-5)-methyltransferase 1